MKDLIERVKKECAGVFVQAGQLLQKSDDPTFGLEGKKSSTFIYIATPWQHLPKFGFKYLSFPKRVKRLVRTPDGFETKELIEELCVVHFGLNKKKVRKELEGVEKTGQWFLERMIENNPKLNLEKAKKDLIVSKEYIKWFEEKFKDPTVIHIELFHNYQIIGNRELTQQVIDEFKKNPEKVYEFSKSILTPANETYVTETQERNKRVLIYDLLGKPREVNYDLRGGE